MHESKLPTATPTGWRSQLNNIARRVTKIDRTLAFIPNLTFDGDFSLAQLLPPFREIFRLRRERNVSGTRGPVGRNFPTRNAALAWIKHEQDSTATPENNDQITAPDYFQSKRLVIKPLRSS
jgi:hypothetical protein